VAVSGQTLLESFEVLYDTVVDYRNGSGLVQVGMGIGVGWRSMRGPAGMPDAEATGYRLSAEEPRQPSSILPFLL